MYTIGITYIGYNDLNFVQYFKLIQGIIYGK